MAKHEPKQAYRPMRTTDYIENLLARFTPARSAGRAANFETPLPKRARTNALRQKIRRKKAWQQAKVRSWRPMKPTKHIQDILERFKA